MVKTTMLALLSGAAMAAHAAPADPCTSELASIVAPALTHLSMDRKALRAELTESADGGYLARLSVHADSADNPGREVAIGWVRLDTRAMKVLDITRDPDHPEVLNVDAARYRRYVDSCLDLDPDVKQMCDTLNRQVPRDAAHVPAARRMVVIGAGRLPFHSAPDAACTMRGVFILTREQVDSRREQDGFSEVEYTQAKSGRVVAGWVESARLRPVDAAPVAASSAAGMESSATSDPASSHASGR